MGTHGLGVLAVFIKFSWKGSNERRWLARHLFVPRRQRRRGGAIAGRREKAKRLTTQRLYRATPDTRDASCGDMAVSEGDASGMAAMLMLHWRLASRLILLLVILIHRRDPVRGAPHSILLLA